MDLSHQMDVDSTLETQQAKAGGPLVVQPRSGLRVARASGGLALNAARWMAQAIVRREPAPLLAVGFGAGLLARTAVAGVSSARAAQRQLAQRRDSQPLP